MAGCRLLIYNDDKSSSSHCGTGLDRTVALIKGWSSLAASRPHRLADWGNIRPYMFYGYASAIPFIRDPEFQGQGQETRRVEQQIARLWKLERP